MKIIGCIITGIFIMLGGLSVAKAQDVYLTIPENNIFNRSEFTSLPTKVMSTNRTNWDYNFLGLYPTDPTFTSASANFTNTSTNSVLPSSVLIWQLESMGGQLPSTGYLGSLPGFQSFRTSPIKWFNAPASIIFGGGFNRGNINFTFKIPAAQFAANAFQAGNYSIDISQNYVDFTPRNFKTILVIPSSVR